MFCRQDLFFPQQEIVVTRNTNRDSWIGQCEVFNRNPRECVGVMVRQLERHYHYNYRLLDGSSFLLQPSGSANDFHTFKFMVIFNDDKGSAVSDADNQTKGANREEIERMVEKGHSLLLEDLCVVYGNVLNSVEWRVRLEKFAPYKANIRVRIPSLPFNKRRTILIPEVGAQNHRVNESNDILQDAAVSNKEDLDQGYQQLRKVLRIKKFTDFEIRAQKLFRNFSNPSEPYRAEHAEVMPNRYIQFKRETRIQLKKGKRSYNPWIGEVTIRNQAPSHYLIYKLRTTAPQHYVVMPTEGVLMPRFRRKMFSLKYQTTKFDETLEHLKKTSEAKSSLLHNASATNERLVPDVIETAGAKQDAVKADSMMDKKFFRSSVNRNAPQKKVRCDNHRFADTYNFASLARDTLNEKEYEEQADSVSIRFLYSDVIAEGEALSSGDSSYGKSVKKKQQQPQQQKQQQSGRVNRAGVLSNSHCSHSNPSLNYNASNTNANHIESFANYRNRSSSASDWAMGMTSFTLDSFNDRGDPGMFRKESTDTTKSSSQLLKLLTGIGREDELAALKLRMHKHKDQAVWMKMTSTERNSEFKDEKNHVQSHVFLLDVAFVDPYAVDERNYNIEELFRHTETLTGGYKMSRCFYPYFVPEDTIAGPVIVYPQNDVIIDRGTGSNHVHWQTDIYLVNIYKSSLYYCIIPQEEDNGQLEVGDEILVTPKSGYLVHYSEKRQLSGILESNMSESLCEQIQIYLRYTRTCQMEDGPIFKLYIFFFTEATAPEWLRNSNLADLLDLNDPTYCTPLSDDALDIATVRIFIKDAELHTKEKDALNYDDLADTEEDLFRPLLHQYAYEHNKDTQVGVTAETAADVANSVSDDNGADNDPSAIQLMPLSIQDAGARSQAGFSELLHHASDSATTQHRWREPADPLKATEVPASDSDAAPMDLTLLLYSPDLLTPASTIRVAEAQLKGATAASVSREQPQQSPPPPPQQQQQQQQKQKKKKKVKKDKKATSDTDSKASPRRVKHKKKLKNLASMDS